MTEEQLNDALRIKNHITQLEDVKVEIAGMSSHRLSYIQKGSSFDSDWRVVPIHRMSVLSNNLDRHDMQIRQEIDEEIERLKKEIEML